MRKKGVNGKKYFLRATALEKEKNPAVLKHAPTGARIFEPLDPDSILAWVLANKKVFKTKRRF